MFKESVTKKFLIDKSKIPDLINYEFVDITLGYVSQMYDSLDVVVKSINNLNFQLVLIDDKTVTKKVTYKISKEEFDLSMSLAGNKILNIKKYNIPNSKDTSKTMNVLVYQESKLMICEYTDKTQILVDTLPIEDWFLDEITDKKEYKNSFLAINKSFKI